MKEAFHRLSNNESFSPIQGQHISLKTGSHVRSASDAQAAGYLLFCSFVTHMQDEFKKMPVLIKDECCKLDVVKAWNTTNLTEQIMPGSLNTLFKDH